MLIYSKLVWALAHPFTAKLLSKSSSVIVSPSN